MLVPDPFGHAADKTEGLAEVVTGDDGTFVVPAIAEGTLSVHVKVDQALPVRERRSATWRSGAIKQRSSPSSYKRLYEFEGPFESRFRTSRFPGLRYTLSTDLATGTKKHSRTAQARP